MKEVKRLRWLGITALHFKQFKEEHKDDPRASYDMESLLCGWCKYLGWDWDGDDGYRTWRYPICEHPLTAVSDHSILSDDYWPICDCWGFRPKEHFKTIAAKYKVTVAEAEQAYHEAMESETRE